MSNNYSDGNYDYINASYIPHIDPFYQTGNETGSKKIYISTQEHVTSLPVQSILLPVCKSRDKGTTAIDNWRFLENDISRGNIILHL